MAAVKEAVGLSRVHVYESQCILPLRDNCIMFLNILTLLEYTQSANNLFHSFTVHWNKEYCLKSNLFCHFTSVKVCPVVILPVNILNNILGSILLWPFHILKTSSLPQSSRLQCC